VTLRPALSSGLAFRGFERSIFTIHHQNLCQFFSGSSVLLWLFPDVKKVIVEKFRFLKGEKRFRRTKLLEGKGNCMDEMSQPEMPPKIFA
jgi:hypothetical protein